MRLIPKKESNHSCAVIAEFKRAKDNEALEKDAASALKQINSKRYQTGLKEEYPHVCKILKIGMAFNNKNVKTCYDLVRL